MPGQFLAQLRNVLVSPLEHRVDTIGSKIAGLLPGRHLLQQGFSLDEFGPGGSGLLPEQLPADSLAILARF